MDIKKDSGRRERIIIRVTRAALRAALSHTAAVKAQNGRAAKVCASRRTHLLVAVMLLVGVFVEEEVRVLLAVRVCVAVFDCENDGKNVAWQQP